MKEQLDKLQLKHEFRNAVDGRTLSEAELDEMCDMKKVREWSDLLTPGMIGCSLSHYHVYKEIVETNTPCALVLEDDTQLSDELPHILEQIEARFDNGTLSKDEPLLLYYQSVTPVVLTSRGEIPIDHHYTINYPVDIWKPITTAAYVITKECASRLANLVYPIRYSPDSWVYSTGRKRLQGSDVFCRYR